MPGPIYIVGTGPMIGAHTARHFALRSFKSVALIARSPSNLTNSQTFITDAAPDTTVKTYSADVTDASSLKNALNSAVSDLGPPEVVLFNAARVQPSFFPTYPASDIVEDFMIPNLGLYTTAVILLPHLCDLAAKNPAGAHPSLFVTSGTIVHQPFAPVFSLSMAKAAQANLCKMLASENDGKVHVAMLTIGGAVSMQEEINNPANIAVKFWELWEQKKGVGKGWEFEKKCGW